MTTTQLQLRRDTTANVQALTPAQGEVIYDVSRKALVVGDGSTAGGNCVTPFTGTWTPQLQFGGGNVAMTFSAQLGWYQVIGAMCFAFFNFVLSAKGSSAGQATIAGLPLAVLSTYGAAPVHITYHAAMATSNTFECYANGGGTAIALGKGASTTIALLLDTDFTNTSQLIGLAIYPIAQPAG